MPREIIKEISINAPAKEVFNALIFPGMIKKWQHASSAIVLPEKDGIYTVSWGEDEDDPDYITNCTILEIVSPRILKLDWSRNGLYIEKVIDA